MSSTQSLPTVVEALDDKAKKQKQAENTQFHVSVARHNIRAVNSELDALIASLRDLNITKPCSKRGSMARHQRWSAVLHNPQRRQLNRHRRNS